jgi:DNA-binding NtrC family response regulator
VADIPLLAQYLLDRLTRDWGREPVVLAAAALALLQRHAWPGNIRELRNVLERALLSAQSTVLEAPDLDFASSPRRQQLDPSSRLTLKELERMHIGRVLAEEGGRVDRAALRLAVPRSTLYQKIKVYGLTAEP